MSTEKNVVEVFDTDKKKKIIIISAISLGSLAIIAGAVFAWLALRPVKVPDPKKDPDAVRFDSLTFDRALELDLKVMDAAAFSLCRDNQLPIIVFDFAEPGALEGVLKGDASFGTVVS